MPHRSDLMSVPCPGLAPSSTPAAGPTAVRRTAVRPPSRRRTGFSLIEILIAIGVILVLMTIGIYGYRSLEDSGARKQTIATLASAASLLKEMNSTGAYSRIEGVADQVPPPIYQLGYMIPTAENPGDVNIGKAGRGKITADVTTLNSVSQTRLMKVMRTNPRIASMIGGLPSSAILPPDPGQPPRPIPVLADAWGNPLLLVPSGGLQGVKFESDNYSAVQTITSSGQLTSPANRAFWASAGPDGDFTKGDDNLYSFQN